MLDIAATCLVLTAQLAYLNHRFVHLPTTIGVMVIALVLSLVIFGLDVVGVSHALRTYKESLLRSIDFSDVLMQGMLSLLLFASALHQRRGQALLRSPVQHPATQCALHLRHCTHAAGSR
jgi:CPA1 family monovalent cation:H+ antiporter